jgi:hypothetical protein
MRRKSPSSLKRKLIWSAAVVFALLVAAYVVCDLFLGSIVTAGVNRFGPRLTQTHVQLADAHFSPLTGGGTLDGLVVGNPPGWSDNPALSFKSIHLEVAPTSVFGDHIVVRDVEIDGPVFNYETRMLSSNIGELLKHLENSSGGDGGGVMPTMSNGRPIKFEVKRLRLNGGEVRLGVGPTALVLPMPPLEIDDLGTAEGGITANQLAFAVMRRMTTSVVTTTTEAMGHVGATMGSAAAENAKKALDGLKGLFGSKN